MYAFIGSEAVANGRLTRGQLRWHYVALHPDVYLSKDRAQTLLTRAQAAWLWTGGSGIVAGHAAAGLHGVRGIGETTPIELIGRRSRRRPGLVVRSERIDDDEVESYGSMRITTPARTALDLARRLPRDTAVRYLDELARATGIGYADVSELVDRYRGARGLPGAHAALRLMDGGSRSPDETRLRLILADSELPRPTTGIVVGDRLRGTAVIGMGWEEFKVGVSMHDGSSREGCAAVQRTRRQDAVRLSGWCEIEVADLNRRNSILTRVRDALRARGRRG